jgi:hypothetical protein
MSATGCARCGGIRRSPPLPCSRWRWASGANAAIYQLLDAIRLRTLPVDAPEELVTVELADVTRWRDRRATPYPALTYPLWERFREHQDILSGVLAWTNADFRLDPRIRTGGTEPGYRRPRVPGAGCYGGRGQLSTGSSSRTTATAHGIARRLARWSLVTCREAQPGDPSALRLVQADNTPRWPHQAGALSPSAMPQGQADPLRREGRAGTGSRREPMPAR